VRGRKRKYREIEIRGIERTDRKKTEGGKKAQTDR
jgi:hypothetical protein